MPRPGSGPRCPAGPSCGLVPWVCRALCPPPAFPLPRSVQSPLALQQGGCWKGWFPAWGEHRGGSSLVIKSLFWEGGFGGITGALGCPSEAPFQPFPSTLMLQAQLPCPSPPPGTLRGGGILQTPREGIRRAGCRHSPWLRRAPTCLSEAFGNARSGEMVWCLL